jgi:predicted nucleic acid-binding protein
MALTHLLDTSVLTRLREPPLMAAVEPRAQAGELARAGIGDLEVGFSARNASEWDVLQEALQAFELIETTADRASAPRAAGAASAGWQAQARPQGPSPANGCCLRGLWTD